MTLLELIFMDVDCLVFDLEGTLVENMPYEELLFRVAELTGKPYAELRKRYMEQWVSLEEAQAYHTTLVKNPADITRLYDAFRDAKWCPTILPGTYAVLQQAQQVHKRLICWTRGQAAAQRLGLSKTGLDVFFDEIIVTPAKTQKTIGELLLPEITGRRFAIIGDSLEEDIDPLTGIATIRVWISDSAANRYIRQPRLIDDDILVVEQLKDLLQ